MRIPNWFHAADVNSLTALGPRLLIMLARRKKPINPNLLESFPLHIPLLHPWRQSLLRPILCHHLVPLALTLG